MAAPSSGLARLSSSGAVDGHHLLGLPDGVGPDEVEVLAASRFPAARWERPARVPVSRRTAAATGRQPDVTPGVLRVARLSTLTGPFGVEQPEADRLGLPPHTRVVFTVQTPRERGAAPYPGGDRDGLKRAFGAGMPVREELRVLHWLVAAARRLGGAVRTDDGVLLQPEMDALPDLTVLSAAWAEPAAALAAVRRVAPTARLDGAAPAGPPPRRAAHAAPVRHGRHALSDGGVVVPDTDVVLGGRGVTDASERRRLHAEADAFDAYMRASAPSPRGAYGVLVDLGDDGVVAVEVDLEQDLPPLLVGLPWTRGEVVAYRVRWEPPDIEELESERPSLPHRMARGRAARVVRSVARELQADVGGEIADVEGFLIHPVEL